MLRLIGLRLLDAIPTVFLILVLVFISLRILPGDPAEVALGDTATQEQLKLELELCGRTPRTLEVPHAGRVVWSGPVGTKPQWVTLPELP